MRWPFGKRDKDRPSPGGAAHAAPAGARAMADFFAEAAREIDAHIAADPQWFPNLPYKGAMSKDQARQFEIEKRAMWRRVIHDARRSDLKALKWTTRGDELVCPQCRANEGRVFAHGQLAELEAMPLHLGCRCELLPERP